jgi:hypothetical protein
MDGTPLQLAPVWDPKGASPALPRIGATLPRMAKTGHGLTRIRHRTNAALRCCGQAHFVGHPKCRLLGCRGASGGAQ